MLAVIPQLATLQTINHDMIGTKPPYVVVLVSSILCDSLTFEDCHNVSEGVAVTM